MNAVSSYLTISIFYRKLRLGMFIYYAAWWMHFKLYSQLIFLHFALVENCIRKSVVNLKMKIFYKFYFFEQQWPKLVRMLLCIIVYLCSNFWPNQNMAKSKGHFTKGSVCLRTVCLQLNPIGGSQGNFEVHTHY